MLIALANLGVYPFGEKSLLVVDMNSEYIDYYMQLGKIAREGGSFLRSWDMGMGLNMMGLIAFYTASPLNFILLLAPATALTDAVLILTALKFGLCGLFFSLYASYTFRRDDIVALACSVAYAMMGYNIAYSSNIMWLDGAYLLPLVLMGVEKLLGEAKYGQYIASLAVTFWASYYIGYMAGIFTFLYFTARFFTLHTGREWKQYLQTLARFLGGAALAAGCCAVLLLPAFLNLCSGQDKLFSLTESALTMHYPAVRIAAKLLPGVYDSLTDSGLPNLFTTVAVALLAVLFFLSKAYSLREKLIWGGFVGFMLLSFSWELLDLAWHAFEDPTWFPARYSFVFSFLLLYLALRGLALPEGLPPARVLTGTGLIVLLVAEVVLSRFRFVRAEEIVLALVFAVAYGGIILAIQLGTPQDRGRRWLMLLALALVCTEACYSAASQFMGIDAQFRYRTRESYYDYRDYYLPAVELAEEKYAGIHRIEIPQQRNANGGMALGYRGISHYSTTTDQTLNALLRGLGYNTGTINEVRFAKNTPLTNGLLGIKYLLARPSLGDWEGDGYRLVDHNPYVGIYENPAAFPLAYFADAAALGVSAAERDPFALQNRWVAAMLGDDLPAPFVRLDVAETWLENLEAEYLTTRESGPAIYTRLIRDIPGGLEFVLENPDNLQAYAFFPVYNRKFARAEVFLDKDSLGQDLAYRRNTVLGLGTDSGLALRLEITSDTAQIAQHLFYGLDMDAAEQYALRAQGQAMEFTRFEDTAVEGTITAPQDGILATSFPYDSGWTVKVDGKKAKTRRLMGAFLAVELPEGEHAIAMRYWPPGFGVGAAISAVCLLGIVLWHIRRRYVREC